MAQGLSLRLFYRVKTVKTSIDSSGKYTIGEEYMEAVIEQPKQSLTQQAIAELSTFNEMISTVILYGEFTVAEDGIGKVEEAHKTVKKLSAAIEKKRKDLKAASLEYGRTVDSIAKQLTEKVDGIESKLKAERDAFDAVEKAEKAAKETEKVAKKQGRINDMAAAGIGIDWIAAELPDDEFMWWFSKAKKMKAEILEERRQAEAFAEKQRKEREDLAAKLQAEQAEELRIRAEEIEAQRKIDEVAMAEERAKLNAEKEAVRKQAEENARVAAIARKKIQDEEEAENLRQWQAEQERLKAAEAARLEALKPEINKVQSFVECMVLDAQHELTRLGNPAWGDDAMHTIRNCASSIVALVIK